MIVFTLTNRVTGGIYVGSTRSVPEERWEQLINQAADGAEGKLPDDIRAHGEAAFRIEEWGMAESPAGVKELIREAEEQLDAHPIRTKGHTHRESTGKSEPSLGDIKRMLDEIRESDPVWEDDPAPPAKPGVSTGSSPLPKEPAKPSGKKSPALKLANGRAGSAEKEKRVKEALLKQREEREQTRQIQSTREADEMREVIMRIEARRASQKKSAPPRKRAARKPAAAKKKNTLPVNTPSRKQPTPDKLATGKATSAEKERRIKEALQKAKEERQAQRQAQAAAEADEMAAILAKIDSRSKTISSKRRKRS
ncbi:MAG: hypothetical protein ABW116_10640 [Candidatus Sedimenticola sp. 20ELBAFRAG]